jgi:peptidoglycan DL-endopeptidase LytF
MNRRDTVLIAVLINMGLLVVLFVGALRPKTLNDAMNQKIVLQTEMSKKETDKASLDQVDYILSKYVANEPKVVAPEPQSAPVGHPQPAREDAKLREIIVKQGDVLEKIARHHGTSVDEIKRVNRLSDNTLQIGQILYIPTGSKISSVEKGAPKEAKYYTVKNGDNPWTIAVKNKIKVEELLRLNGLDEAKAKKLKPGDELRIQ